MTYQPSYRAPQRRRRGGGASVFLIVLSVLLIIVGGVFIGLWAFGSGTPEILGFLASPTPTPTETPTPPPPTETPTITSSPTQGPTATLESSPTAAAPFLYIVQQGDTLSSIAERFAVEVITVMALNGISNDDFLTVGQELIVPDPNTGLPSPSPIPPLVAGSLIDYLVLPGDTLASIAAEFLSTEEGILAANEDISNPNQLFVGDVIKVPIRLITPTPGPSPTPFGTPPPTDTVEPPADTEEPGAPTETPETG
ncbi:MAG: LysM domain-containing protein [Chloroflexi bacterium]|nr:MAG: LysM domain-containing protein [Chloroflexota bacterium]MBL1193924.1 LysM domain-containing protein [Chloroflexota bacterium]NOH11218.1 LysM peptidoglycan-binding domain-containing protein [Chloroflexota bacterium]